MANDRLYLRCKYCGDIALLAKYWGHRFDLWDGQTGDCQEPLDVWLAQHTACRPQPAASQDLQGEPGVEVVTESSSPLERGLKEPKP